MSNPIIILILYFIRRVILLTYDTQIEEKAKKTSNFIE